MGNLKLLLSAMDARGLSGLIIKSVVGYHGDVLQFYASWSEDHRLVKDGKQVYLGFVEMRNDSVFECHSRYGIDDMRLVDLNDPKCFELVFAFYCDVGDVLMSGKKGLRCFLLVRGGRSSGDCGYFLGFGSDAVKAAESVVGVYGGSVDDFSVSGSWAVGDVIDVGKFWPLFTVAGDGFSSVPLVSSER